MRKLRSSDGVRPTGRSPSVMSQSHHAERPALRRNRRTPRARSSPLRHDGTQGTDPVRPEKAERARGADKTRQRRLSKTRRQPMNSALQSPCRAAKRPPAAMPALLPINARAPAKTSPPDRTKRARQRSKDPRRLPRPSFRIQATAQTQKSGESKRRSL
jgi:hypothetical protein